MELLAPAKINLFLHITGKRDNGYHELESLISFADFGDILHIQDAKDLSFSAQGAFEKLFKKSEIDTSPTSKNIIIKTLWALAELAGRDPKLKIILEKNLPLAAGIGGGSADAAAMARYLVDVWNIPQNSKLDEILLSLGADVPVCFYGHSAFVSGIGEDIKAAPSMPKTHAVLVNPRQSCSTQDIFEKFNSGYRKSIELPKSFETTQNLCEFLKAQHNDLEDAAIRNIPAIYDILTLLDEFDDCLLARMSGSGATCFGIFETQDQAINAKRQLRQTHPDWWIKAGTLN